MNGAERNQDVGGGSDDDSGKDSDEEEISKAKEKFEDFFQRTKKYWISFARDRLSRKEIEEEGVSVEEYALVLAEEEFMKETVAPAASIDLSHGSRGHPALNRRSRHGLPAAAAAGPAHEPGSHRAVQPQSSSSQRHAANAPLQQQVNVLQQQLQRVDLDEGIE